MKHYFYIGISLLIGFLLAYIIVNALAPLVLFVAWLMLMITILEIILTEFKKELNTFIGKVAMLLSIAEAEAVIPAMIIVLLVLGALCAYVVIALSPLVKVIAYILLGLNIGLFILKHVDYEGYVVLKNAVGGG